MERAYRNSLSRAEVRRLTKALRAAGKKLPKVGYCIKALGGEVCRHPKYRHDKADTGIQVIGVMESAIKTRPPGGW